MCQCVSSNSFIDIGFLSICALQVGDPQNLNLRLYLNDELMQEGNSGDMMFSVADLISFLSQGTTLSPGTVILTGTPPVSHPYRLCVCVCVCVRETTILVLVINQGVGFKRDPPRYLKRGDVMRAEIDGIGSLSNVVGEEHEFGVRF